MDVYTKSFYVLSSLSQINSTKSIMTNPSSRRTTPDKEPEIHPPVKMPDNPPAAPPEINPRKDPGEPDFSPAIEPGYPKPEIERPGREI